MGTLVSKRNIWTNANPIINSYIFCFSCGTQLFQYKVTHSCPFQPSGCPLGLQERFVKNQNGWLLCSFSADNHLLWLSGHIYAKGWVEGGGQLNRSHCTKKNLSRQKNLSFYLYGAGFFLLHSKKCILPISVYTLCVWLGDLWNCLHCHSWTLPPWKPCIVVNEQFWISGICSLVFMPFMLISLYYDRQNSLEDVN